MNTFTCTSNAAWTNYTTTLNVSAGTHTIEFLGTIAGYDVSTAIDNVSLPLGAGSLPATTVLTVAGQSTSGGSCGTFDLGGFSQTVAGLSGGGVSGGGTAYGTITNSGSVDSVLTIAGTSQFDGVLADGATNKLGLYVSGGSLTLTGPNTFTGPTTVNGGTLQIGNGGSGETLLSPTITLSNNATAAFNHADSLVYIGSISGSGGLVKSGGGRLTLIGSQTYSGATTVANGTLGLTAASIANPSFESPVIGANSASGRVLEDKFRVGCLGREHGDVLLESGGGDGYGFTAAPAGNQAFIIKGTGSISQVVDFSGAGSLPLTRFGEGRGNWWGPDAIEVLLDGVQMGAIITPPTTAWSSYTTILNVATAGTHTIEFLGTTTVGSTGDFSTAIDKISLPSGGPLPATTILTVAGQASVGGPSGTFDLGGINQTLAGLAGGGVSGGGTTYGKITNSDIADAVLTVTGTNQFDGAPSDGATNKLGLYVSGGGLTLTGPNTFTGPTTVNGGTLQIGNGGSGEGLASPTITMSNNATAAFNHADALLYVGSISGSGQPGQERRRHADAHGQPSLQRCDNHRQRHAAVGRRPVVGQSQFCKPGRRPEQLGLLRHRGVARLFESCGASELRVERRGQHRVRPGPGKRHFPIF